MLRLLNTLTRKSKKLLINTLIRCLEPFIAKDYSLWLFSMEGGRKFSGNILYFYEYVKRNTLGIKTICFAEKDYVRQRIEQIGGKTCRINTWQSFIYALKAGVCVFSHEMASDLNNFSKRGTVKINLWHGLPLKRFQYGSRKLRDRIKNRPLSVKVREKLGGHVRHEEYDFIAYSTPNLAAIMTEAFNNQNLYLTGDPRDDFFYRDIRREDILQKYGLSELIDKQIVTYLPTFRDVRKTDEMYRLFANHPRAEERLADFNAVLLQKNHTPNVTGIINERYRYDLPEGIETQELMYISVILITDYSSCYFDFLHARRPIIFYAYDLEEYIREDRELYYDYFDELATPGVKTFTEDEVLDAVERYLRDPAKDREKREISLAHFYEHIDGHASRRVLQAIQSILHDKDIAFSPEIKEPDAELAAAMKR